LHTTTLLDLVEEPLDQVSRSVEIGAKANCDHQPQSCSDSAAAAPLRRMGFRKRQDRQKKLFQFLNAIGARALRIQLGRVLEMAESSQNRYVYENKIIERFGGQQELELVAEPPPPAQPRLLVV
jgi:hypothetical protein